MGITAAEIEEWLVAKLAATLRVSPDEVDIRQPFTGHGLDSLTLYALTGELAQWLNRDLLTTLIWEYPTIEILASHLALLPVAPGELTILRALRNQPLPLSFAQERIWRHVVSKGSDPQVHPRRFIVRGILDACALKQSLSEVVRRHEILRTTFRAVGDRAEQIVHPPRPFPLPFFDLTDRVDAVAEAQRMVREETLRAVDLEEGPLFRAMLLRTGETEHRFALIIHHLIYDASSLEILYAELGTIYDAIRRGDPLSLPEPSLQMADFAAWQRRVLRRECDEYQKKLSWWRKHWNGPMPPAFTPRFRRNSHQVQAADPRDCSLSLQLPHALYDRLNAFRLSEGTTLYIVLLAGFVVLLRRYTCDSEFVVGTYVSDRNRFAAKGLMGFFVNLLALRVNVTGCSTYHEVLNRLRGVMEQAFVHQDLPFEELSSALRQAGCCVPNVEVIFQHVTHVKRLKLHGLDIEYWGHNAPPLMPWGLSISTVDYDGSLGLKVAFNGNLYDPLGVREMVSEYEAVLQEMADSPDSACFRSSRRRTLEHELEGIAPELVV